VHTRIGLVALAISGLLTTSLTGAAQAHVGSARPGCKAHVASLKLPKHLHAGESASAKVRLSCTPAAAVRVRLADDQEHLRLPHSVRVRAGRRAATFTTRATAARGESYVATVTARGGGSKVKRSMKVSPGLSLLQVPPSSQPNDVGLLVLFTGPLPGGGAVVNVSSDNKAVTVPPTATFQVAATGGEVPDITVHEVTKKTRVTFSVTYGRRTLTTTTVLVPPADPVHPKFELSRQGGDGPVYGGMTDVQFDVHVDAPAPAEGLPVTYSIVGDDPDAVLESAGGDVIGEGFNSDSTDVSFADVTSAHTVTLQAQIGETIVQLPVTIQPAVTEIDLPDTVVGGDDFTGTVRLAGAASVDTVVYLSPSWGIIDVPLSVTVPAGQTSATFIGHTTAVDDDSLVFVTGYYGDGDDMTVGSEEMTVTP
jgi:hypothetical protein